MSGDRHDRTALGDALDELESVAGSFSLRVGELTNAAERAPLASVPEPATATAATEAPPGRQTLLELPLDPAPPVVDRAPARRFARDHDDAAAAMEEEMREHLVAAKRRADAMVRSMLAAVESEANAMRAEAEAGIRARWAEVDRDTDRQLEVAEVQAEAIVERRKERLEVMSGDITEMGERLTAQMADAEETRLQFLAFVEALSATASRIARGDEGPEPGGPTSSRAVGE